jgi:hypothetical protein
MWPAFAALAYCIGLGIVVMLLEIFNLIASPNIKIVVKLPTFIWAGALVLFMMHLTVHVLLYGNLINTKVLSGFAWRLPFSIPIALLYLFTVGVTLHKIFKCFEEKPHWAAMIIYSLFALIATFHFHQFFFVTLQTFIPIPLTSAQLRSLTLGFYIPNFIVLVLGALIFTIKHLYRFFFHHVEYFGHMNILIAAEGVASVSVEDPPTSSGRLS